MRLPLPIASILMVAIGSIMFFLYIVFNSVFHGASGLKEILWSSANRTMTGDQLTQWNELMVQLPQGFGIACAMCFLLAIVFFVVDALRTPPGGLQ